MVVWLNSDVGLINLHSIYHDESTVRDRNIAHAHQIGAYDAPI